MTRFESRQSGLVVPVEPPEPPEREWGPLEVQEEEDRRRVQLALQGLLDIGSCGAYRGGIKLPGRENKACEGRRALLEFVGRMLLGEDFTYEEYT